jgi:hypothetical protein
MLMPEDRTPLYTQEDIEIFQKNLAQFQNLMKDQEFINRAIALIHNVRSETYTPVFEHVVSNYPNFVIQIYDSCNGILFLSERSYNDEIFTWNIGARSEIILALLAQSAGSTQPIPFFQDLLQQGYGYAKRTRFLDARQIDRNEYHFICRQVVIGDRIVFLALREQSQ